MPRERSDSQLKIMNALSYLGSQTLKYIWGSSQSQLKYVNMLGSARGWLQHMPELATTSRKWTHTVQTGRRGGQSSVLQCQTEYKWKHTHAVLNVHPCRHAHILSLCSREGGMSTHSISMHTNFFLEKDCLMWTIAQRHRSCTHIHTHSTQRAVENKQQNRPKWPEAQPEELLAFLL